MNLFPNPTYNGYFMKGGSTAKPIAGTCTKTAYSRPLNQAKLTVDNLMQGSAVELKNTSLAKETNSNNDGLSGNVFTATTATTVVNGFIVNSPNDILLDGDTFPRFLKNQISRVALIGSGATVYLPADSGLADVTLDTELAWDTTKNVVCAKATGKLDLPGVRLEGQLVNGLVPEYDATNNVAKSKDALVVRVVL